MKKNILSCLLLLFISVQTPFAQSTNVFLDVTGGGGRLFPHPNFKYLAGPVNFYNLKLGARPFTGKNWQRVYHYPELGIGLSQDYLTSETIGNPTALFSFINLPLIPERKLKLNLGLNFGVAWGFNSSSGENQKNMLIGSKYAAYISMNVNSAFHINPHLELLVSAEQYHISNGNTSKPNKGINMAGAETGLRYKFSSDRQPPSSEEVIPEESESSVMIFGAGGWTQESNTFTSKVPVGSLSSGYYRSISQKSRLNASVDLFYDQGDLYKSGLTNAFTNVFAAGISAGHELTISNLSILTSAGIYLRDPCPYDPFYYTLIGLRYRIAGRVIPSITMKAHGVAVDFLEWGLGFVLWKS